MTRASLSIAVTVTLLGGCAPPVPLARGDADRVRAEPSLPIVYVRSKPPWVDCPNDEGRQLWEFPASLYREPLSISAPVVLVSSSGASPFQYVTGGVWGTIVDEWTRSLQTPPMDPALATARRFLEVRSAAGDPIRWGDPPLEVAGLDPDALASRQGRGPVLVFDAVRWVLVGCFYTYKPWFNVRATLIDSGTGRTIWRETCGGTYPGGWPAEAWPSELDANGQELYARIIDQLAGNCAAQLAASFSPGPERAQ